MSILRMASFKASYALFLKLDSGAIRTIAMSASAMFGNALVGFRSDTTILLQWESSFTGRLQESFWHTTCQNVKLAIFAAFQSPRPLDKLASGIPNATIGHFR